MKKSRTQMTNETQPALLPEPATSTQTDHKICTYLERKKDPPPKVCSTRLEDDGGDVVTLLARYADALGSVSDDFRNLIFEQVGVFDDLIDRTTLLNSCLAMLHSIKPRNELETLLLVEIFMLHNCFAETARQLTQADDQKYADSLTTRIDKLLRSVRESVSAFQRLRGQASQQRVTVEHVHVHKGGQAIVGAVNRTGGEENV